MPVITRLIQIEAGDVVAPNLTGPTATATGQTTASGSVTTDEGNGTLYFLASPNPTETASTVVSTGASQVVSGVGVQSVNVTSLTASTAYYLHYVHVDSFSNQSDSVPSAQFTTNASDVTAPVLTSPVVTATTATTATGSVTTNEANGTLFFLASENPTELAATVTTTGQSQAVTTTGVQSITLTGLSQSSQYYLHFVHRDSVSNDSVRVTSAPFTTGAVITRLISILAGADLLAPVLTSPVVTATTATTATGSVTTNEANGTLFFLASENPTELAATVTTTGQSQAVTTTGVQSITLTGLSPATNYYAHFVHRDSAGNNSVRVTSAQFTTSVSTGGGVVTRAIQILPEALVVSNLGSARIGGVNTINTQGYNLQTAGTVTAEIIYDNVTYPLYNVTVTSQSAFTALFPVDGIPLGGSCTLIVRAGTRQSPAFSFTMGSAYPQGLYTTLNVPFSGLHPDSPLNNPSYSSLIVTGAQVDFTGVTAPDGFPVTIAQNGLLTVTGASASNYDQRVTFAIVQPSSNRFRRSTEGVWTLDTPTPNTINTVLDNVRMVSGGATISISGTLDSASDDITITATGTYLEGQAINGFLTTNLEPLVCTLTGNLESATGSVLTNLANHTITASGIVAGAGAIPIRYRLKYLKVIEL